MKLRIGLTVLVSMTALVWASPLFAQQHFLTDPRYRKTVQDDLAARMALVERSPHALFSRLQSRLDPEEGEALEFLYAYMPLSDLADYDGLFFLKQIHVAFEAKRTFPWGSQVPEELFRHFVLPYRANNENLDSARLVVFHALKDRIKGMSMREAVLEVNHWCHERATYQPTDIRTSAPLAVINTGFGRCGEETTLLVTALRAVCIPARQCYTPRWAHCDDNHAWVEAWVDGKWHFLGGCEPEADLDMAWFKEPARRAMLVHTKVFGRYEGPEEANVRTEKYSEINLLSHYAPVKKLVARVVDSLRRQVSGAHVEFQLYNSAEFYPLASGLTDAEGARSLTTGLGDLLVWAWMGEKFGYKKVTVESTDTAEVVLDRTAGSHYSEQHDLVPPIERPPLPATAHDGETNSRRLQAEDRIRAEHAATFMDSAAASALAAGASLNADSVWMFIRKSRGNWRAVAQFITEVPRQARYWIFPMLSSLADKDLRDVSYGVLQDHLGNTFRHAPLYAEKVSPADYILCPRVNNELLVEYRKYLQDKFELAFIARCRKDPSELVRWVKDSVKVNERENWYRTPLTPRGVFDLRVADASSRDIFFVSACRSFGIPARLEPASKQPQYFDGKEWQTVEFGSARVAAPITGRIILDRTAVPGERSPVYWVHYTLAKFDSGKYRTLDYDFGDSQPFPLTVNVEAGHYLLVTGNRMTDGTVLSNLSFFTVAPGETTHTALNLREAAMPMRVQGKIDMKTRITGTGSRSAVTLSDAAKGKGLLLAWIDPDKEPTKHALKDIEDLRQTFERWGGGVVLFTPGKPSVPLSATGQPFQLPLQVLLGTGSLESPLWRGLTRGMQRQPQARLPVLLVADVKGDVYFLSEGYRIGVGEEVAKTIARLKQ
ncbi:transglutaminase domain-containing protein [bacterium]|nr:MAG: transglutaminase domain-containing protein [bacterium]